MLKLKLQYFPHLMGRTDSFEKTLMLGKTDGGRRRGRQRMRWLDSITDSMGMNLSRLWKMVEDRGAWHDAVHGVAKSRIWLSDWTTTNFHTSCFLFTPFSGFLSTLLTPLFVVQFLSQVWLFVTPWSAACQACLSFTNSWSLLKLMSIESVMPSNRVILCRPLLLLPSIFPSIRVFSNESALHIRWPKYWSFKFSISPSNEYSGWFPLELTGLMCSYIFFFKKTAYTVVPGKLPVWVC